MKIQSNNLINEQLFQTKKFDKDSLKDVDNEKLKEVCNDFEAFFLNQIMSVSLKSTNIAGNSAGSDIIKGMYTQAIADNASGTFGISTMLYEFLTKENSK